MDGFMFYTDHSDNINLGIDSKVNVAMHDLQCFTIYWMWTKLREEEWVVFWSEDLNTLSSFEFQLKKCKIEVI